MRLIALASGVALILVAGAAQAGVIDPFVDRLGADKKEPLNSLQQQIVGDTNGPVDVDGFAQCGAGEVLIFYTLVDLTKYQAKLGKDALLPDVKADDDTKGTPVLFIEVAATGYDGVLTTAPKKCKLKSDSKVKKNKYKGSLDCDLGKDGANMTPSFSGADAEAANAACKKSKVVTIPKSGKKVKVKLSGSYEEL